ncbi:MAG: thioredoxin family protein [Flavobacteriaceae bacterium]|jgi:peroxiredoxin
MKIILFAYSLLFLSTPTDLVTGDGYKIGDVATDFSLPNVDGEMVSLADFEDAKGFILIFTCNTCPYSVAYEDRIIALDKAYKSKGYPVIAINPNDPAAIDGDDLADMKVRATEKGFSFPYLQDVGQQVYPQYGATKTPHVFVLQKEGNNNIVRYIGAIDDSSRKPNKVKKRYVEQAVDALLAGKSPSTTTTKAIGCSIKTL